MLLIFLLIRIKKRLLEQYKDMIFCSPSVDKEKRLVGIVTVDDLIDVIEQEATRDIYAAGAVQPGDEDDYFQSSLFTIARRRILWLLILVLANGLTTKVIAMNDQILKEIVLLAAFIPRL